jgi:hypothetical protein
MLDNYPISLKMDNNKLPPDKDCYKCIKMSLEKLIKNETYNNRNVFKVINDVVKRTNNIVCKTYMLLRLIILDKYRKNEDLPNLDIDFINIAFKVFIDSKGKKSLCKSNKLILENLKSYYDANIFGTLEDGTSLNPILIYSAKTMYISIINNIKLNFTAYLNRYINGLFYKLNENKIKDKDFKKQLGKELKAVKDDIINNTLKSDSKYHKWITINRKYLVPILNTEESIYPDLHTYPLKYLKYMIYLTGKLEDMELTQFQFFPLQTNAIPKNIRIDNRGLITLFEDNISEKYKIANQIKNRLWNNIFNIKKRMKKYNFDYTIITDGYSVALQFINNEGIQKKNKIIEKMQTGKNKKEAILKGKNNNEKEIIKQRMIAEKIKKAEQMNNDKKNNISNKIKDKKKNKDFKSSNSQIEFPYIEDISKAELGDKHIFIDPGKRTLFTMLNDEGVFYQYHNKQYIRETKRLIYYKKTNTIKKELNIIEIETTLSNYNSKTVNYNYFQMYIKHKIEANKILTEKYFDKRFRKLKWYSFINKKRAEDNLLNKIETTYSKDHKIIIGDWSIGKQMSNFISTPNIRLKRKLKERFDVYNFDEYKTSCINYKTEKESGNLIFKIKENTTCQRFISKIGKKIEMHSILTYQMENQRLGCINRDKNAVYNIRKIFNYYMLHNERPEVYRRTKK